MGWKMVRDKHREQLEGKISGQWRVSPDPVGSLIQKLGEEYGEAAKDRDPAELYDLMDGLEELIFLLDPDGKAEERHLGKVRLMGTFSAHLEWHPNPNLDLWLVNKLGESVSSQENS